MVGPGAPFDGTGEELTLTSVQIYFSSMTVRRSGSGSWYKESG